MFRHDIPVENHVSAVAPNPSLVVVMGRGGGLRRGRLTTILNVPAGRTFPALFCIKA